MFSYVSICVCLFCGKLKVQANNHQRTVMDFLPTTSKQAFWKFFLTTEVFKQVCLHCAKRGEAEGEWDDPGDRCLHHRFCEGLHAGGMQGLLWTFTT